MEYRGLVEGISAQIYLQFRDTNFLKDREFQWVKSIACFFQKEKKKLGMLSIDGSVLLYFPKFVARSLEMTGKSVLNYPEECSHSV